MSSITRETREEGRQFALPMAADIRGKIVELLSGNHACMTAEEVASAVGCSLNSARSRLTELKDAGRVEATGKRLNRAGTVRIAVWVAK